MMHFSDASGLVRLCAVAGVLTLCAPVAFAQNAAEPAGTSHPHGVGTAPAITSISVCSPTGAGGAGSCPSGSLDTLQTVLGPNGGSINNSNLGMAPVPDEHSSVFAPGMLGNNADYLFFLASPMEGNPGIGVAVLSGGTGPNTNGQWTLNLPTTDGYGSYTGGFGQVFSPPMKDSVCPTVADGNPAHQDQTFDMNYAAPGSVVKDPTGSPGSLLMIYEGTNSCIGNAGGAKVSSGDSYISLALATSLDNGKTWPTYRGTSTFNFTPLPNVNPTQGPHAPTGGLGANVCMGNDCTTTPPASYGRYPIGTQSTSLASLMAAAVPLTAKFGYQEISGFVDDAAGISPPYIYAMYSSAHVARALLNGGTAPLSFMKWNGSAFAAPGIAGNDISVLSAGAFQNCEAPVQSQYGSSISYVETTQQYLLTFVCVSPGDPALGQIAGAAQGGAWFYSTSYDLSDPSQWTLPQEITGSWSSFDQTGGCPSWNGYYPTFMSLGTKPGHLTTTGHVFSLWGCQGGGTPGPGRQMASRAFTITSGPSQSSGMITSTLPHVADGNGFDTLVLLINTGTTDANYSLQFFNQSGTQVTYQLDSTQAGMTGIIHAGLQAVVRTAGGGTSTNLGWGQLTAPPSVKGMLIYQQQASATSLQEGSAPFTVPSTHFFVPFDNAAGATTSIGFVNPSATQKATVNFTVNYASGGTESVPPLKVNPLQQVAQPLTGIWANTAGKRGLIEVDSNTPIGLVAFRFQGAAFTLFDTISDTSGGTAPITSTIAHAADGNNFKSTFLLTNSGSVDGQYTLNILNATGQTQTFGFEVANPLSGTVPAGSTLTVDTTGLGSVTNLGWAQLSAPPAVSGLEVFRQTNPGKSEQQATIPISQTNLSHFFLPFDNAGNTTSIALANPDPATTATINVTFRYVDGTSNTGQFVLPAHHYKANQLASLFAATTGKAGVAEFTSNVPVAMVEVRFNPTQAFTSLRAVGP